MIFGFRNLQTQEQYDRCDYDSDPDAGKEQRDLLYCPESLLLAKAGLLHEALNGNFDHVSVPYLHFAVDQAEAFIMQVALVVAGSRFVFSEVEYLYKVFRLIDIALERYSVGVASVETTAAILFLLMCRSLLISTILFRGIYRI